MKEYIRVLTCCIVLFCTYFAEVSADNIQAETDAQNTEKQILELQNQQSKSGVSSELFFNLGNLYYKSGDIGAAVLNYEKALRVSPSNTDARNNLKFVANQVQTANESNTDGKNMDPSPTDAGLIESINNTISLWSSNRWAIIGLVFFLIAIGCASCYIFVSSVIVRKTGFFGGIIALILCGVFIGFSIISRGHALNHDYAVLMSDGTTLMLEPGESAKPVGTPLSAGTKFKVVSTDKDSEGNLWTEVYLNSDYNGWVKSSDIALIEIPEMKE